MGRHKVKIAALCIVMLLPLASIPWRSPVAAPQSLAAEPKDTKLKGLLKERLATVREILTVTTEQYKAGTGSFERVHQALKDVMSAELDLCDSDKERITVLEKGVAQAKDYEKLAEAQFKVGKVQVTDVLAAKADRLEIEIALERLKTKAKDQTK